MIVAASVTITVNNITPGAAFVSGSANDWATLIMHELGHAYWDLYGPGTSKITPDGPNAPPGVNGVEASEANTALVKDKCKL